MDRRTYLASLGTALTASLAGCSFVNMEDDTVPPPTTNNNSSTTDPSTSTPTPTAELVNASFEDDLTGWTIGKDLPESPGTPTGRVKHDVTTSTRTAADGNTALKLYIEGRADDGTIWVEQKIDFTDIDQASVDVYSNQKSFNILSEIAFFAGAKPSDGLQEKHFNRQNDIEAHQGWKRFFYDVSDISGVKTLAVGMNVVWETGIHRLFDNVKIYTEKQATATPTTTTNRTTES